MDPDGPDPDFAPDIRVHPSTVIIIVFAIGFGCGVMAGVLMESIGWL